MGAAKNVLRVYLLAILLFISWTQQGGAQTNPILQLQPGHWYEVQNSNMNSVDPCPVNNCSWSGVSGISSVIDEWSGGAFDTRRDRLIVWGGGHWGYAGNELYGFDIASLTWSRLTEPSDPPAAINEPYASDGQPASRHSYNYLEYVASVDRFCSIGGSALYGDGEGRSDNVDCFDFESGRWEQWGKTLVPGVSARAAYYSATGDVWAMGTGFDPSLEQSTILRQWIPSENRWFERDDGNADLAYWYYATPAIDPVRGLFVAVGEGGSWVWDISDTSAVTSQPLAATGDTEIEEAYAPGFVYDPVRDLFVAWDGGSDIYTLDIESRVWTRIPAASANTVNPTPSSEAGTYGRFRYVPSMDVFIGVNAVNENVFIYRLGDPPTSIGIQDLALTGFALEQNFPNPFSTFTTISYNIPAPTVVTINVYDLQGRLIETLVDQEQKPVGRYKTMFHAPHLSSGVYFVRLSTSNQQVAGLRTMIRFK